MIRMKHSVIFLLTKMSDFDIFTINFVLSAKE